MSEKQSLPELPEWWAPDHPEIRAHGTLSVGPDGATVTLVDHVPGFGVGNYSGTVLLGETATEKFTLLHPMVTASSHRVTQERAWFYTTAISDTLLRGMHVEDPAKMRFDYATVRLAGLREMSLIEAIKPNRETMKFVSPGLGARFVKLPGKGQLVFRAKVETTKSTLYQETTERDAEVEIHPNKALTLFDFDTSWLRPLEALTILGARGSTDLQHFTLTKVGEGEPTQTATVESRAPALAGKPPAIYQPLLPLAALGDEAERVIGRWWRLYSKLGPSAGFLHAALSGEMYLEQKLLLGMSFIEAYHREIHDAKRRSLRQRTDALIQRARQVVPEIDPDAMLAKDLADTRNALAHLDKNMSGKVLDGEDLIDGVKQLRLIIEINLLLDLKLTKALVHDLAPWSYSQGDEIPFVMLQS